jgi:uncharacterized phiE125 gp8 family phage protein
MTLVLVSGPSSEPVTLVEAKNWVKVTDGADDSLLQSLIVSARLAVEAATNRILITQQWRVTLDAWPSNGVLALPLTPVRSISRVRVLDGAGVARDQSLSLFTLDASLDRARIMLGSPLASPGVASGGISIDLVAGYGDAASAVPEPLRLPVRQIIAVWFANRGDGDAGAGGLPASVTALLAPYRIRRLA